MERFNLPPEQLSEEQQQWLDEVVTRQLAMEAQVLASTEAGAVVIPAEALSHAMLAVRQQYEQADDFQQDLVGLGLTEQQLEQLLQQQLKVEAVLELKSADIVEIDEAEALQFYQAHPDKFLKPEQRQSWHLLITLNDEFEENSRETVMKKLVAIREETSGDLALFRQRAKRHSECPSALSDGEMGWIPRGHLFPAIDKALFELEENQITEVIETEVGLHLVYCSEIQQEEMLTFEQVAPKIIEKLTDQARRLAQKKWLSSLQ